MKLIDLKHISLLLRLKMNEMHVIFLINKEIYLSNINFFHVTSFVIDVKKSEEYF